MWILTKQIQSITSVSALGTKESEEDLEKFCQMSEKSLMWRSKPSLLRTWRTRWKRGSFIKHLYTRTLRPSLTESFEDKWTSYLEDSLASRSLKRDLEKLPRTQGIYSHTSPKASESANLELFSSKTLKESSVAALKTANRFSNMSSEHWKSWVIEQRREYSQRVKSASHIREKESTSLGWPTASVAGCVEGGVAKNVEMNEKNWATPSTMDNLPARSPEKLAEAKKKGGCKNLREEVVNPKNWGTPKEQDSRAANTDRGKHNLGEQVHGMHNYPTPTSRDWKGAYPKKNQEEKPRNLLPDAAGENTQQDLMKSNTNGKSQGLLKLNPSWVEQLMGLPIGWTDCDFSEME